jgi:hypothetical protein
MQFNKKIRIGVILYFEGKFAIFTNVYLKVLADISWNLYPSSCNTKSAYPNPHRYCVPRSERIQTANISTAGPVNLAASTKG